MQPLTIDDTATGRQLVELQGMCEWSELEDPGLDPDCRSFPDAPFAWWARDLAWTATGPRSSA